MEPALPGLDKQSDFINQLSISAAAYSGPILPEQVRGYDQIVPGIGEEIIRAQLIKPQERLDRIADAEIKTAKRGQGWAIFIGLVLVFCAVVFLLRGNNIGAGLFMGPVFIAVITQWIPRDRK